MRIGSLSFICTMILSLLPAQAEVRRLCKVSYMTQQGYSRPEIVEVVFDTADELNKATNSMKYGYSQNYALIWFGQGQVAILKFNGMVINAGAEFDNGDFVSLFGTYGQTTAEQINSDKGTVWRIEAKDLLNWIDPRANQ